jgi:predicted nucleotidyltransferase
LADVGSRLFSDYDTGMATADLPIWAPTPEKMQAAIERLVAAAQPTRIILFGSRARGDADDRSDVDLLVIKHQVTDRYEELVALDRALAGILMPVDILLVSEAEFEERAEQPGTVERAARKEGRVLYAAC